MFDQDVVITDTLCNGGVAIYRITRVSVCDHTAKYPCQCTRGVSVASL